MTRTARLRKLALGIGFVAAGIVGFHVSASLDPANRLAFLTIVAVVIGASWIGQAIRGRQDGPIPRDEQPPLGKPVSADRLAAGLLGAWLVPGLGHWLLGRRAKAVLFFITITSTFLLGAFVAEGRNFDYGRDKIYFVAYSFNAMESGLAWLVTRGWERDHIIPLLNVGYLYCAIASLLNLVVIMDVIYTSRYAGGPILDLAPDAGAAAVPSLPPEDDGTESTRR